MKTSIANASITFLLGVSLFSCSKDNETEMLVQPRVAVESSNPYGNLADKDEFIISDRAFIACAGDGTGEWCSISGSGSISKNSDITKPSTVTISRLIAVGDNSGDNYTLIENKVFKVNSDKTFNIIVTTKSGKSIELKLQVGNASDPELKGSVSLMKSTC